jgi:hypothetical protein
MVAVIAYAVKSSLSQSISIVGENLVDIEFPNPNTSPIYLKPITYLYIASLIFMYTELELNKERIKRLPDWAISSSKFIAFLIAVTFFFELAYNLVYWSGELAAQAVLGHLNPDAIVNYFPEAAHPWNVVFASKLWTVFLITGVYVFYYLSKIQDSRAKAAIAISPASRT